MSQVLRGQSAGFIARLYRRYDHLNPGLSPLGLACYDYEGTVPLNFDQCISVPPLEGNEGDSLHIC